MASFPSRIPRPVSSPDRTCAVLNRERSAIDRVFNNRWADVPWSKALEPNQQDLETSDTEETFTRRLETRISKQQSPEADENGWSDYFDHAPKRLCVEDPRLLMPNVNVVNPQQTLEHSGVKFVLDQSPTVGNGEEEPQTCAFCHKRKLPHSHSTGFENSNLDRESPRYQIEALFYILEIWIFVAIFFLIAILALIFSFWAFIGYTHLVTLRQHTEAMEFIRVAKYNIGLAFVSTYDAFTNMMGLLYRSKA